MPRFNPDPTKASAGIVTLPKDSYSFEIGDIKSFKKEKDGVLVNHGLAVPLTVVSEGPYKGKVVYPRLWMHNEGSQNATKRFQMAATGFGPKQEEEFNDSFGGSDWGYDPDDKNDVGTAWRELKGKVVICDVEVAAGQNDTELQNFKTWRVYGA